MNQTLVLIPQSERPRHSTHFANVANTVEGREILKLLRSEAKGRYQIRAFGRNPDRKSLVGKVFSRPFTKVFVEGKHPTLRLVNFPARAYTHENLRQSLPHSHSTYLALYRYSL